ncbi:MAG: N-acetylmuramoyl-L-alanine amidase [Nitrospirae bacterium]|nr:N-acetylmuramoyl-L-alanine amidase [Nitrospirota bacterium]
MISFFLRKKELKMRRVILQSVYEDNLVILGRGRNLLAKRRLFLWKKQLLAVLLCVIAVMANGRHVDISFPPKELTAQINMVNMPSPLQGPSAEGVSNPAELSAVAGSSAVSLSRMFGLKIRTIMIDAGHGGSDSGTVGKMGTKEKDVTLDIAKRLRQHLMAKGNYRILMTREDDSAVPLNKRVELAKAAKADLFISVHINYLPQKPINIIETYYFGPSTDANILRLAEQENAGSEHGLSDFKVIVEKLGKTMKLQESREFAESIQSNMVRNSRKQNSSIQDFGVKRAPFVVLLGVEVPSVLAEVSCMSNREEEKELQQEGHRENIARSLALGIFDYLNKGDLTHEAKR